MYEPKLFEKSDPDPTKIIPDPQHCSIGNMYKGLQYLKSI